MAFINGKQDQTSKFPQIDAQKSKEHIQRENTYLPCFLAAKMGGLGSDFRKEMRETSGLHRRTKKQRETKEKSKICMQFSRAWQWGLSAAQIKDVGFCSKNEIWEFR